MDLQQGNGGKLSLFHWRYTEFVKACREEFGFDDKASNAVLKKVAASKLSKLTLVDGDHKTDSSARGRYVVSSTEELLAERQQDAQMRGKISPKEHGDHRYSTTESIDTMLD